jgi:hypothetical protein
VASEPTRSAAMHSGRRRMVMLRRHSISAERPSKGDVAHILAGRKHLTCHRGSHPGRWNSKRFTAEAVSSISSSEPSDLQRVVTCAMPYRA